MEKKSVLIVDDEHNIRLTVSRALEDLELDTETAVNGEEALAKLEARHFDVVLLDLRMPGMDGMEVLRNIRNQYKEVQVVVITAHGTIESAVEAMKLGGIDFIQKPFSPKEIRNMVSKILEMRYIDEEGTQEYQPEFEIVRQAISEAAAGSIKITGEKDTAKAESYNILGSLSEKRGNFIEAIKYYRISLEFDSDYEPASINLNRVLNLLQEGKIALGQEKKDKKVNPDIE